MINYYKILDISQAASDEEIKEAYRKKALQYHPDVNDSPESHVKFQEIGEAYNTLSDPLSRQKFDIVLEYGFGGVAAAIKKERAPKHKDPAYVEKSEDFIADYWARKSQPVKKARYIIIIENILYASMVIIGLVALSFSSMDLMAKKWRDDYSDVAVLVFSIGFLVLLVVGWKLVLGRKYKF